MLFLVFNLNHEQTYISCLESEIYFNCNAINKNHTFSVKKISFFVVVFLNHLILTCITEIKLDTIIFLYYMSVWTPFFVIVIYVIFCSIKGCKCSRAVKTYNMFVLFLRCYLIYLIISYRRFWRCGAYILTTAPGYAPIIINWLSKKTYQNEV